MVETIKHLRQRAAEKAMPQRFVFHHVPKCGGTSVGRALRKRYILSQTTVTPESSYRAFEAFTGRTDREKMLVDVLDLREQMLLYHMFEDIRGISLHVRFSPVAYAQFADSYKFITILREPVARFISHYNWSHNKPHAHANIEQDFESFLDSERAGRLGATFVEYYCGLPKSADIRSDDAIRAAIENLQRFSVVGDLSHMDRFERDIRQELGVVIKVNHENKIKSDRNFVSVKYLSDRALARVRELCAPDIAVWNAVFPGGTT